MAAPIAGLRPGAKRTVMDPSPTGAPPQGRGWSGGGRRRPRQTLRRSATGGERTSAFEKWQGTYSQADWGALPEAVPQMYPAILAGSIS